MVNPMSLQGRHILITGASSGIGRATAVYLSKLGARIVCTARSEERLQETLALLEGDGHAALTCDLSKTETIEPMVREAVERIGRLNGLVNCAGIPYVVPLNALTPARVEEAMRTNFYPFVELARLFGKKKYASEGSIVTISSILTSHPRAYETGYISSKGAMNAAVGSLACELAVKSIRVNGIIVGNVWTAMTQRTMEELHNEKHVRQAVDAALLGMAQPEDIAGVAAFLISDMSKFITGRNLYADGGLL